VIGTVDHRQRSRSHVECGIPHFTGVRAFLLNGIDIEGKHHPRLTVLIRRQFDSVEGGPVQPREIRESAERIRALAIEGCRSTTPARVFRTGRCRCECVEAPPGLQAR